MCRLSLERLHIDCTNLFFITIYTTSIVFSYIFEKNGRERLYCLWQHLVESRDKQHECALFVHWIRLS
jgi:hypothetical protein